jgi:hypothetical protein
MEMGKKKVKRRILKPRAGPRQRKLATHTHTPKGSWQSDTLPCLLAMV